MHVAGRRIIRSRASQQRRIDAVFAFGIRTFLVAALLYGDIAWIAMQPDLQIEKVTVAGTRAIDPDALAGIARDHLERDFLPALSYESEFFAPTDAIAATILAEYPRIARAEVIAAEQIVRVDVTEYGPAYLWCGWGSPRTTASVSHDESDSPENATTSSEEVLRPMREECLFADERGYLFAHAAAYSGSPFVRFFTTPTSTDPSVLATEIPDASQGVRRAIGTAMLSPEEFLRVTTLLQHLTHVGLSPRSVTAIGEGDYEIATEKTWTLLWASELPPEESVERLERALTAIESDHTSEEPVRVVDLRFGNKIFYR